MKASTQGLLIAGGVAVVSLSIWMLLKRRYWKTISGRKVVTESDVVNMSQEELVSLLGELQSEIGECGVNSIDKSDGPPNLKKLGGCIKGNATSTLAVLAELKRRGCEKDPNHPECNK